MFVHTQDLDTLQAALVVAEQVFVGRPDRSVAAVPGNAQSGSDTWNRHSVDD